MSTFKQLIVLLLLLCCSACSIQARVLAATPSICRQPPPRSEGLCTIEIEGYYYEPITQDCQVYSVGACRLTRGQSFGSVEDCRSTCVRSRRRIQDYYNNE